MHVTSPFPSVDCILVVCTCAHAHADYSCLLLSFYLIVFWALSIIVPDFVYCDTRDTTHHHTPSTYLQCSHLPPRQFPPTYHRYSMEELWATRFFYNFPMTPISFGFHSPLPHLLLPPPAGIVPCPDFFPAVPVPLPPPTYFPTTSIAPTFPGLLHPCICSSIPSALPFYRFPSAVFPTTILPCSSLLLIAFWLFLTVGLVLVVPHHFNLLGGQAPDAPGTDPSPACCCSGLPSQALLFCFPFPTSACFLSATLPTYLSQTPLFLFYFYQCQLFLDMYY